MSNRSYFIHFAFLTELLIVGCSEKSENTRAFHVYGGMDTTDVSIGEITRFQVWAMSAGKRKIEFPLMELDDPNITVSEGKEVEGEFKGDRGIEFQLTFWDTGSYVIPPYAVQVLNAESNEMDFSIATDPVDVAVHSLISENQPMLRDIKPPVRIPAIIPWKIILSLLGIALSVAALVWMWRKRIQEDSGDQPHIVVPSRPPYEIAMEKLNRLRTLSPSNAEEVKLYYADLSYLLREYLEHQYFVRAIEMTTSEIKGAKHLILADREKVGRVIEMLKRSDLAKFARFQPSTSDCERDIIVIDDFLRTTRLHWTTITNGVKPREVV
ncbi:MAG: hypothetical protein VX822_04070 [Candidatus Neomarinimicrobiota bacterium]|nr:hypothetical protein [Candidatus Neomarinimicrobiota bacterium]